MSRELRALAAVRLSWAAAPDDVWRATAPHVDGLQEQAEAALFGGMEDAWRSPAASPLGLVLQGARGVGKTHLLGWIRDRIQQGEGYFFLVPLLAGGEFWRSAVQGVLDGLLRPAHGHRDQLALLLHRLAERTGTAGDLGPVLAGHVLPSRAQLDAFVAGLWRLDRQVGLESADTARALLLYSTADQQAQETGRAYLTAPEDLDGAERAGWGLRGGPESPQLVLRHLSRLLALTGPTVIAVDQVDTLIAQARSATATAGGAADGADPALDLVLNQVADGLMTLREETRRTMSVLACLPTTWSLIRSRAVDTAADRFRVVALRDTLPSTAVARELVATRLAARYERVGYAPPSPTWPVAAGALDRANRFTARSLLQRVDEHVRQCVATGEVRELTTLEERPGGRPAAARPADIGTDGPRAATGDAGTEDEGHDAELLALIDTEFARHRRSAAVEEALDPAAEDVTMPRLLGAGLLCLAVEQGAAEGSLTVDPPPGRRPALHARLRRVLDPATEDEQHWAFRAVLAGHHRSVQSAIQKARLAAGHEAGISRRRLVLLRNAPWPTGRRTAELLGEFTAAGGVSLAVGDEDVRTLVALCELVDSDPPGLQEWLVARRPASGTELLTAALGQALATGRRRPTGDGPSRRAPADHPAASAAADGGPPTRTATAAGSTATAAGSTATLGTVALGAVLRNGRPFAVSLESLTRHAIIVAGSGSGKTVLLRRLVEECALQGVSAIVLDPNNDLARLGEPWPAPPREWGPGDADRAAEYLAATDVVVWTPGRAGGRPLAFRPLPDFAPVLSDPDELHDAVEAAVASLAPRARATGTAKSAEHSQAVLREAVEHFARRGGTSLADFIELLRDLPDGVSRMAKSWQLAHEMADTLTAATVNDQLFGGTGEPVDPGVLLTPAAGKRARVSVVSLVGLPTDAQRQGFVNQLQMALFAWIKRHPATGRPLSGLLVMDEAQLYAPSRGTSTSTTSTVALASQARKYGLGLVFATQAPRGLHNQVPGNAATQVVGFLNSVGQIEAARDLARAKGGDVPGVSRLRTGQFYAATEGQAFDRIQAPMCLSHHPRSALAPEEVLARARVAASATP